MSVPLGVVGEICVEFYYSMYGEEIGALRLLTRNQGTDTQVWSLSGNQGQQWVQYRETVRLTSATQQVYILGLYWVD